MSKMKDSIRSFFTFNTKQIARIGIVAALRIVISTAFAPIMFGPWQLYMAGIFSMLSWVWPKEMILAAIIAQAPINLMFGGDILNAVWGGIFMNIIGLGFIAKARTWNWNIWLTAFIVSVISAIGISPMIAYTAGMPFQAVPGLILSVGIGEAIVTIVFATPLALLLDKMKHKAPFLQ